MSGNGPQNAYIMQPEANPTPAERDAWVPGDEDDTCWLCGQRMEHHIEGDAYGLPMLVAERCPTCVRED